MDMNSLKVFNSFYELGMTEKEFRDIESEQKHTERTGLYIGTVKDGKCICVSHDEKHKIIIKEIVGKIEPKPKSRVLFKTLIAFPDLPKEVYALHQIAQYRALDDDIMHTATNMEEFKDKICDRFADGYPKELGEMYETVYGCLDEREKNKVLKAELIEEQLSALFWLFGEDVKSFRLSETRRNISKIIKVFSHNNRRLAIIQTDERFDKHRGSMMQPKWTELIEMTTLKIMTFIPRDEKYNYVCPNREIYRSSDYDEKAEIWLDDDLCGNVTVEELKVLSRRCDREWILLNADEYNRKKSAIRVELMSAKRKDQENQAKEKLALSIKKQFKNGKVIRHGITFTPKSISYEDVTIKGSKMGDYLAFNSIVLLEEPVFRDIFEGYIYYILKLEVVNNYSDSTVREIVCDFEGRETISVGNVKVRIKRKDKTIYVNGHRIKKSDVGEVVRNAINSGSQKEYENYIEHTSMVNLKLQERLRDGGIKTKVWIDTTEDNCLTKSGEDGMLLSIPVERKEGKIYVRIGDRERRVKNTPALLDLEKSVDSQRIGYSGGGSLQRAIRLLFRAVEGITPDEIGYLIRNGMAEYDRMMESVRKAEEEKTARSMEFLSHTMKLTKAMKVDKGYMVKGLSGTYYFIDEERNGVWTLKNGKQDKYLCIVDIGERAEGQAGVNDTIAKRMLALSKDKVIAKELYENGDRMDAHWAEIREPDKMIGSVVV